MPIDQRMVKWDEPDNPKIDPRMVKWDEPKVGASTTAQEAPKSWQSRLTDEVGGIVAPVAKSYRDFGSGAIRGAGSIGATILSPLDALGVTGMTNAERRTKMDEGLQSLFGADTDSLAYSGGKLGAEIAGTAGVGGLLAKGMSAIPYLAKFAPIVESGGFNLGNAATASKLTNAALRTGGGMVTGGATAGLINPSDAPMGVAFGGAMPGVVKVAGEGGKMVAKGLDSASRKLMNSALKPTIEMHRKGQAAKAVQTMLDEGVSATKGGVSKLETLVDDINSAIKNAIGSSNATVDKQKVLSALDDTRSSFINDVSPASALSQIDEVGTGFINHPKLPTNQIPVQLAQDLKTGTYRTLKKSYGEMKGAETEARKALARGLKEEIANAVPGISNLNKRESDLINALKVAERRALMDANKNPVGLGPLAPNKAMLLAFLADRSAALKSFGARGLYQASRPDVAGLLANAGNDPFLRSGLLAISANQ